MNTPTFTLDDAQKLIIAKFIHEMPFNQLLGLEVLCFDKTQIKLVFNNKPELIGNFEQQILHGGVIASVLDVASGLVCIGNVLNRMTAFSKEALRKRLSTIGTIDLNINYLHPGRGKKFIASGKIIRTGNKISVARAELHNEENKHIATGIATYLVS
ncbi:MAG TPA: thioesterase family protein [Arsenophonus nasoniae]|uniref:thioesterase family protein n=1 Tax=Arsenophonus nasoniae TaxID=638 RepID=UPI00387992EB